MNETLGFTKYFPSYSQHIFQWMFVCYVFVVFVFAFVVFVFVILFCFVLIWFFFREVSKERNVRELLLDILLLYSRNTNTSGNIMTNETLSYNISLILFFKGPTVCCCLRYRWRDISQREDYFFAYYLLFAIFFMSLSIFLQHLTQSKKNF